MKAIHKITLLLLLFPVLSFAGITKGKYLKEKKINRAFTVNSTAALQVMNKYGNVTITTWDENKTTIDVVITVSGNDEEDVDNRLASINIEFKDSPSLVEAYTRMGKFKGRNISMEINYTVKMPKNGTLGIGNTYGDIRLGKMYGGMNVKIQYGSLSIDEANSENNKLDLQYASGSKIGYIKSGDISMQYSSIDATRIGSATVKSEYSDLKVNSVTDVKTNMAYSNLVTGNANKIIADGDYSNVKCDRLSGMLTASLSYGDLKVNTITNDARVVAVKSEYGETRLGFAPDAGFTFDFTTEYGSISGKDLLNFNEATEKSFTSHYSGVSKSGNGNCKVTAKSSYGDIKISRN